jgi:exodeoxyribonuclease V alpha subunit
MNPNGGSTPSHSQETITGLIERITFASEETGFHVLKVQVRGHKDLVTVVGASTEVHAGEWLDASGHWGIDPRHGQQFKADTMRTTRPTTTEGVQRYLASGMIKGIGPRFSERMVARFGVGIFEIIEKSPDRLREVTGIGPGRQAKILSAWKEQKAVREIMVFLHSHGVTTSRAFRIHKAYGETAIEQVRQNPYRLARDIRGIGFKTADRIAASVGIGRQSDVRARAGVEFVLQDLTNEGHCAFPREGLVEKAVKMLEIPAEIVNRAVDSAREAERVVEYPQADGQRLVYLVSLDVAERMLARRLAWLARGEHPCPVIDIEKAVPWVEGKISLKLAQSQLDALALAMKSKVLVITGGPGVGKTTLVNAILKIFSAKKLAVVLCAPTGRAAKRMTETTGLQARTIHRMLEFDPATNGFKHDAGNPLEGDVFVVDETSMVDLTLAYQTVRAVPKHAALILVGDVDQLPSVGPGCVLRDIIDSGAVPVCRLTEVFRQAARSEIVTNAHRVNQGLMPVFPAPKTKSDFYFCEVDDPEKGAPLLCSLITEHIPRRFDFRPEDIQILTPMQRGDLGARNLNLALQASLNPVAPGVTRYGWTFRVGDKVMQTVNNYDKDVFNGDIGRIADIDENDQEMTIRFDDREVAYDFKELDEIVLSYATTIHKSQGSEYPAVIVPMHMQHFILLQRNLLYTAITRGRKLVVLVGTKKAIAVAVKRADSRRRVTTLRQRLETAADRPGPTELLGTGEVNALAAESSAVYGRESKSWIPTRACGRSQR